MNKSELIKEVALKGQLSFREAANAVDAIFVFTTCYYSIFCE